MQVQSEASTEMDAQDTMVDFSDFLCDLDHDEEDRPDNYSEEQGTDNPPDNTDRVEHPGLELDNRGSQNVTRQDAQQLRVPIRGVAQIDTNMPASITQLPGRLGIDLTPAAVYDIFRSKGPIFDVKILCNLTLFFFGLASAEGIWQMREFCNQSAFETTPMIREPTVVQTLQAGGQAKAGNAKSAFEMRVNRSWLVEHRNRRKQYYQSQDGGRKRRKGMHRSEYSRPDSRAFREITSEAYAEQVPPKQSYRLLHTLVKNELALGRHWYSLKESFSRGMSLLAVIPPTGPYFVSDTAIATLSDQAFSLFLDVLPESRQHFLEQICLKIDRILNVFMYEPATSSQYRFVEPESSHLLEQVRRADILFRYCELEKIPEGEGEFCA